MILQAVSAYRHSAKTEHAFCTTTVAVRLCLDSNIDLHPRPPSQALGAMIQETLLADISRNNIVTVVAAASAIALNTFPTVVTHQANKQRKSGVAFTFTSKILYHFGLFLDLSSE